MTGEEAEGLFAGSRTLLELGPIGLAGLTMVLAVIGLMNRELSVNQFRLLVSVLACGFLSLVALLVHDYATSDTTHEMSVRVSPIDNDTALESYPDAKVLVDQVEIDRSEPHIIDDNFVLIVDVNRAIEEIRFARSQQEELSRSVADIQAALLQLEQRIDEDQQSGGIEQLRLTRDYEQDVNEILRSVSTIDQQMLFFEEGQ